MKTLEAYFTDWEADTFGYGYGTGEPHILPLLKRFFELNEAGRYDYRVLEQQLSPPIAWLLINILCKADILEYGSSPRFPWLTGKGRRLQAFLGGKTPEELINLTGRDDDTIVCYPDACNCGPHGYEEGARCANPFWRD